MSNLCFNTNFDPGLNASILEAFKKFFTLLFLIEGSRDGTAAMGEYLYVIHI